MVSSWDDLLEWVERFDVETRKEPEDGAVTLPTLIDGEQHAATIVWDRRVPLVHVIQPLDVHVLDPKVLPRLESAIIRVNYALVVPGFGYNHGENRVYYRWVLPRTDAGVSAEELNRALRSVLETCRDFLPAFREVAAGALAPEDALAHTQALRQARGA